MIYNNIDCTNNYNAMTTYRDTNFRRHLGATTPGLVNTPSSSSSTAVGSGGGGNGGAGDSPLLDGSNKSNHVKFFSAGQINYFQTKATKLLQDPNQLMKN